MSNDQQSRILITRADDMGYTHSGNLGTLDSMRHGIIRSASILVVAPWFEEAAQIARDYPNFSFGVHMGIIGEWRGYRWRPVLPYSEVRSLVDEDGFLHRSPTEFWAHSPDLEELEREFCAQVELAKKKGITVDYIDIHYMMPYDASVRSVVERVRDRYGIPVSQLMGEEPLPDFGIYFVPPREKEATLAHQLEALEPGIHLLVAHPGYPSIENDALVHFDPQDIPILGVGCNRAAETAAYTSPKIRKIIEDKGIILTSYREFCEKKN